MNRSDVGRLWLILTVARAAETIPPPPLVHTTRSLTQATTAMNRAIAPQLAAALLLGTTVFTGCRSPYYADQGAGVGALGGAGVGALVGNAVGNTAGGALIGAGVGALSGAAVGSAIDDVQAQNRAEIAAQLGRQVAPGSATIEEVVAMSQQGVQPVLIQNYVRTSGMARPLTAADVIYLHNSGVATDVIQAMQAPPAPAAQPMMAQGPPVIVEERYYPDPWYGPQFGYYYGGHCHRPAPRVSWGVSVVH
jgi:outer membrane lipoprotein SlyB